VAVNTTIGEGWVPGPGLLWLQQAGRQHAPACNYHTAQPSLFLPGPHQRPFLASCFAGAASGCLATLFIAMAYQYFPLVSRLSPPQAPCLLVRACQLACWVCSCWRAMPCHVLWATSKAVPCRLSTKFPLTLLCYGHKLEIPLPLPCLSPPPSRCWFGP